MKRILWSLSLALITSALALGAANASYVPANITVSEAITTNGGEYTVINNSDSGIYAFFVGNDSATRTSISNSLGPWGSKIVSPSGWNNGIIFSDASSWTPPNTANIPWNTAFANAAQAVGYWSSSISRRGRTTTGAPIAAGATQGGFDFSTFKMMDPKFIAFGQSGGIIGQGSVSVVPIPAAVWLFGSGLVGLIGLARRKKA